MANNDYSYATEDIKQLFEQIEIEFVKLNIQQQNLERNFFALRDSVRLASFSNPGLTMSTMRDKLLQCNPDSPVKFADGLFPKFYFQSYRGYYWMAALGSEVQHSHIINVSKLIKMINLAIGCLIYGYKGGDYMVYDNTPVWHSNYDEASGLIIVDVIQQDDYVLLQTLKYETI